MNSNPNGPDRPHESHEPEEVRHREVAYDVTDLSARGVVVFLVFLAIGCGLVALSMWGLYKRIAGSYFVYQGATSQQQLAAAGGNPALTFPAPRLQPYPVVDLERFNQQQEEWLNSYGWVDQVGGRVHIPIAQAMELTAGALPVRANAMAPTRPVTYEEAGAAGGINIPLDQNGLPPAGGERKP